MTCFRCKGMKWIDGFGCPGFLYMSIKCHTCNGTGVVEDYRLAWYARGRAMRSWRLKEGYGLTSEAERRGISAVMLSDMECGIIEPQESSDMNYKLKVVEVL